MKRQVYLTQEKYDWLSSQSQEVQSQFYAHEAAHIDSKNNGLDLTEEEVQKIAPLDLVLDAVQRKFTPSKSNTDEYKRYIEEKYVDTDKKALKDTISKIVMLQEGKAGEGRLEELNVILAYDTGLDPDSGDELKKTIQAGDGPINTYLLKGNSRLIEVRKTGRELLDAVRLEAERLKNSGKKYVIVTISGDTTMNALNDKERAELGKVINVKNPQKQHIPVIGLYDVALRIAFELGTESILRCLNSIALNPENKNAFTKDDIDNLLKNGFISILPKIVPINTDEAREAYMAARQALKSL
jgi:hypothetical protein